MFDVKAPITGLVVMGDLVELDFSSSGFSVSGLHAIVAVTTQGFRIQPAKGFTLDVSRDVVARVLRAPFRPNERVAMLSDTLQRYTVRRVEDDGMVFLFDPKREMYARERAANLMRIGPNATWDLA